MLACESDDGRSTFNRSVVYCSNKEHGPIIRKKYNWDSVLHFHVINKNSHKIPNLSELELIRVRLINPIHCDYGWGHKIQL